MNLCECGCREEVKSGNRYIYGHNFRCLDSKIIKENNLKKSKTMKGKKPYQITQDIKNKISKTLKAKYASGEIIAITPEVTDEHRRKLSESHKGQVSWNKGIPMKESTKKKLSKAMKGRQNPFKGKSHTEEAKRKMSINGGRGGRSSGYKQTEETKNKISETATKNYLSGKRRFNGNGISGDFYSAKNKKYIHYRSLLELVAYELLEKLSKVKCYQIEPFSIKYKYDEVIRRTIPDILVIYTDKSKELIEIKPVFKLSWDREKIKLRAMENYALENNFLFTVWTEDLLMKKRGRLK